MRRLKSLLINLLLTFFLVPACSGTGKNLEESTPDVEYDCYLLLGQSNMVGYADLEAQDTVAIRGVFLLDDKGEIIPASSPLARYSTIRFMGSTGYGLGASFGKNIRFKTGHYVLLVVNPKGGSAIREWQKVGPFNFYSEAVRRAKEALSIPGVHLKGILWHQGESDSTRPDFEEYWYGYLSQLVSDFREDFNDPYLPFVIGETYYGASYADKMNPVVRKVSEYIPYSDWVSAEGCGTKGDNIHFDHAGYDLLGERYAEKVYSLAFGN